MKDNQTLRLKINNFILKLTALTYLLDYGYQVAV